MANQWLGNLIDKVGTGLGLPEYGLSESVAGNKTSYTGITPTSKNAGYSYNPSNPSNYKTSYNTPVMYPNGISGVIAPANVLGASTGPTNSGGNTISTDEALKRGWDINNLPSGYVRAQEGPSQSDIEAQQNKVRDTINSGFSGIFSQLDSLAGLAPQYQAEDERFINDQYGIESQARQNELAANQAQLGTYRTDVANREKATLSSIAQDMRNMLKAGNSRIGAMGAADSSAVPMYNYALSKQTGQRTADVRNQSNAQYGELDRKEIDVKSAFDSAMTGLASWKNEQLINAKERARQLLERVNNAKVGADQARLTALTNLETNILTDVTNNIRQIESEERANAKAIQNWATQRVAQLQDYKLNLQKSAAFDPKALTYDALQGINYSGAPTDTTFYNPMALQKKKADPWA